MSILSSSYNGRTENINWNDGMLEGWNNGLLEEKDNAMFFLLDPSFHYSIIPIFQLRGSGR
jgi:hypothetical protein